MTLFVEVWADKRWNRTLSGTAFSLDFRDIQELLFGMSDRNGWGPLFPDRGFPLSNPANYRDVYDPAHDFASWFTMDEWLAIDWRNLPDRAEIFEHGYRGSDFSRPLPRTDLPLFMELATALATRFEPQNVRVVGIFSL